jgi:limonene-1,2-epoxide hydrolase
MVTREADVNVTTDPQTVVVDFLDALAASELDPAMDLLAEDVEYVNVGLPAVHGRRRVAAAFRGLRRPAVSFEVCVHAIAVHGTTVLTERTDVIAVGPFRTQFWVWGRFEVHDGRITLWRDSFDVVDITRATVRGLVGIVVPGTRPTLPAPTDAPGR